jgi:glycine cleavage system H lipoate-binding protein
MSHSKHRRVIPEGEVACVWMTAGVLGFRLCDREFDCATCPLDRALRNIPAPGTETEMRTAAGCVLPEDLFFHPGHTWVRVRPGGEFEVGMDDLARRLVHPVLGVRLPHRGEAIAEGRPVFTVKCPVGEVTVTAPFEGIVTRLNGDLDDDPALLHYSPFSAGWAFRAIPENPARALAGLREGREAERWAESECMLVRDLVDVARADRESAGVGATLADGGQLLESPLAGIAPEAARRILVRVLRPGRGESW